MASGIYKITNTVNGKVYVGSTKNAKTRRAHHWWQLGAGRHRNRHLQNAWNKYGKESFRFDLIEETPVELLIEREQYWIDSLGAATDGYNIQVIADRPIGVKRTAETRRKQSKAMKGKKFSPERCAKMSERMKGSALEWLWTPEVCAKRNAAQVGRVFSEKSRQKMSAAAKARWSRPEERDHLVAVHRGKKASSETRARQSMAIREFYAKMTKEERKAILKTDEVAAKKRGVRRSPETIAKISAAAKGKTPHNKGKRASPETIAKLRASHIGIPNKHKGEPLSEETKRKLSESARARHAERKAQESYR